MRPSAPHGDPAPGSELDPEDTEFEADDSFDDLLREAAHVPELSLPVPKPGSLLRARFEVGRRLGEGGMGIVHEAFDRESGQRVALKTLSRLDPGHVQGLKREFRSLSGVVHPNLIRFHELFADGSLWFFTMDLVQGRDFLHFADASPATDSVQRSASDAANRARGVVRNAPDARPVWHEPGFREALRQLVRGVAAVHAAGKLHCDLKPSNVLVDGDGRVVILDFGLVVERDGSASSGDRMRGTPAYIAPEVVGGAAATEASDWYAVGVMLYQALTGGLPFEGAVTDVLRDKQTQDPPPVSGRAPGAPPDLAALCMLLLARNPRSRPGAMALLAQLGEGAPAPSSSPGLAAVTSGDAFIGRESQVAALWSAFEQVSRGAPRVVFVHGSSGMGKTALSRHFLDALERQGRALVLSARCYEREAVPFKAFDGIVDALVDHLRGPARTVAPELLPRGSAALCRIFPALSRVPGMASRVDGPAPAQTAGEELRRAFSAFQALLSAVAERSPLVLFIDDLQWSDLDSARLLEALLAPPGAPSMLVIGAYRREDAAASTFLRQVLRAPAVPVSTEEFYRRRVAAMLKATRGTLSPAGGGVDALLQGPAHVDPEQERLALRALAPVEDLAVDRLPAPEARRLARVLLADTPGDVDSMAAWVAAESEGVPFFVHELSQSLHEARHSLDGRQALRAGDFASLRQVLGARMQTLPEPAHALLLVVALAGRPIRREFVLEAAGLSSSASTYLDTLGALHLLRSRGPALGDEVEIYHDRVADMVRSRMRPERVRAVHADIARTLERSGDAQADWLAEHFQGAGMGERAGQYAVEAASRARGALAFTGAEALYRWAAALFSSQDAARVRRGAGIGAFAGGLGGLVLGGLAVLGFEGDAGSGLRVATFVAGLLAGGPIGMMAGSVYTLVTTPDPTRRFSGGAVPPAADHEDREHP